MRFSARDGEGARNRLVPFLFLFAVVLIIAIAVVVTGGNEKADPAPAVAKKRIVANIATAKSGSIDVYRGPGDTRPWMRLSNPTAEGAPRVFRLLSHEQGWLRAQLPVRPNGSVGWIRFSDVTLSHTDYRVDIELKAHRLTVRHGGVIRLRTRIAVGKSNTPTPGGQYYLTSLLKPPNRDHLYGAYAFGLSGYSETLHKFRGGNGELGIHGTSRPKDIGKDVSNGCIRMRNADITTMARTLPLGTPVFVHR